MLLERVHKCILSVFFLFILAGVSYEADAAPRPQITSTSPLPAGMEFTAYSFTFSATNGTPPYSNWTITAGSLPAGLLLNPATGVLSGAPTQQGVFSFDVRVTDSQPKNSFSVTFSLTITSACAFIGTSTGSISFGAIDPSTPGQIFNTVTGQVLFECDATLAYSFTTNPTSPQLTGANTIPFVLGLAATGLNVTSTTQISLLTTSSSILQADYQNAVAGANSGSVTVTIRWAGTSTGSINATVTATGAVLNACAVTQAPGTLTFNIDPSVSGTTYATISPDMQIKCTNGATVNISAASQNGGALPKLNCSSGGCGSAQISYTFKILNSSAWPVSTPGLGFGGAGTALGISGSMSSTDYADAPIGTYSDVETVTISY